ncbi:MAG: hypothetical protein ACXW11_09515 [Methylotenera sp.]
MLYLYLEWTLINQDKEINMQVNNGTIKTKESAEDTIAENDQHIPTSSVKPSSEPSKIDSN